MRIILAVLGLIALGVSAEKCDPNTCVLPNCRCFDDPKPPGNLAVADTPQLIMVTMENNVNDENLEYYQELFNIVNPNGCAIRGTFFIQDDGTDYGLIRSLFMEGHEIGVNSVDGTAPADSTSWIQVIKKVRSSLDSIGVDIKEVRGVRVPQIAFGGSDELIGIGDNGMLYDSSCSSVARSDKDTFIWPYTFDVIPAATCDSGSAADKIFPGKWQVPVDDLHDLTADNTPCVVPSGCRNITTKQDAFDLFFKAFETHYTGKRTPMMVVVDPAWAKNQDLRDGTIEFLQYVRAAFGDNVWIVPVFKALQWIQEPTPVANLTSFAPFDCK